MAPLDEEPDATLWILDAMAILQSIRRVPETFGELAEQVFGTVMHIGRNALQIDFVCDQYPEISIKNIERGKRGKGGSLNVRTTGGAQKCPKQWKKFLSNGKNKSAIIKIFVKEWATKGYCNLLGSKVLLANDQQDCYQIKNQRGEMQCTLLPDYRCNHEEADTRMFFHALKCAQSGHRSIVIKSSDTDVEVLALHHSAEIPARLYLCSGTSQRERFVDVCAVSENLGNDICKALVGMHSLTGYDTTSAFVGKGKKRGFDLIHKREEFIVLMHQLGENFNLEESIVKACQKFVCALYGRGNVKEVNEVRYHVFCSKNLQSHQLPLVKDSLVKHLLRVNYQARIWKLVLEPQPIVPPPQGNGWPLHDGELCIDWFESLPAPLAVLELLSCHCGGKCENNHCCCISNQLHCTDACGCSKEKCENSTEL